MTVPFSITQKEKSSKHRFWPDYHFTKSLGERQDNNNSPLTCLNFLGDDTKQLTM